jgi:carbonic anhydrase
VATHAPLPELPPILAWRHVQEGNARHVAAAAAGADAPNPAPRPSGAGKYVCAVVVCADADVDAPALLGLARADTLVLAVPGPFASPETAALLERAVVDHRLSLVIALGHDDCASLAPRAPADALHKRREAVHAAAQRRGEALSVAAARLQRDLLLASSETMRTRSEADQLRVLPATVDVATGAVTWHAKAADALPVSPVK